MMMYQIMASVVDLRILARFYIKIIMCITYGLTFYACTVDVPPPDMDRVMIQAPDATPSMFEEDMNIDQDMSVDDTEECTIMQCQEAACRDSDICQPCEEGGNCLFTGELRVFGNIKSKSARVISDLFVTANCGDTQEVVTPNEQGDYALLIQVENCEQLTITAQRAAQTEGYVPLVYRYRMPPPVNTIHLDLRLEEATEIRCDRLKCEARDVVSIENSDYFRTGYAYNSSELNEISSFGAIFESDDQELLWLHRFIYRDFRDERSQTLDQLYNTEGIPIYLVGLSRLNFETRAWVNDLSTLGTFFDYHQQIYSDYATQDDNWERYAPLLTDPNIDADQDGLYETIDMATYKLNLVTGKWEIVTNQQGQPLFSKIWAELEPGYDNERAAEYAMKVGSKFLVPVPNTYLREIQTNGTYGPAYNSEEIDEFGMRDAGRGFYRRDYTGIPHLGSGIYAMGQAIPRACWLIKVEDECNQPILGTPIQVTGVNHGYRFDDISDQNGLACVEVGRSESEDQDFDGDQILNERFDVEIKLSRPLNVTNLLTPDPRTESTPIQAGTCQQPDSCIPLSLRFARCLE